MGNAEYMGSRPESDVSGGDIMAENEDLMLGEEELSEDDEGQMLEGPLLPGQAPMVIPEVPMPQEVTDGVDGYFCKHYKRKCMFVTPCCNGLYRCRFCHDEAEDHTLTREDVVTIECCDCKLRQGVNENCENCGLCRVGGRENYFHCGTCDMCLPNHLHQAHKCVEKVSRSNCPVCLEDIHTSRISSSPMDTDANMDTSSVSMTPEPSPLREDMASSSSSSSFSSPPSPSPSSAVRRLQFSEDDGSGEN